VDGGVCGYLRSTRGADGEIAGVMKEEEAPFEEVEDRIIASGCEAFE
jgi:hypothetical protein